MAENSVENIATHFSEYLRPVFSETESHKQHSFKIRHKVYCEELNLEPLSESLMETDSFDPQSFHCLIQHKTSKSYAGTVRVITSRSEEELLPIEIHCREAISKPELFPDNFPREDICEISRLAVPIDFRRRKTDQYDGAAVGVIDKATYSETELRCFPFIAVGLYLAATSVMVTKNIKHCYVMVEPRLARSMRFIGLPFVQIGPVVEYHGKRAPFYLVPQEIEGSLKPEFQKLLRLIDQSLKTQMVPV